MGNKFNALKIAKLCSLVLLVKLGWRLGEALGREVRGLLEWAAQDRRWALEAERSVSRAAL